MKVSIFIYTLIIAASLALASGATAAASPQTPAPFPDTAGHWAEEPIRALAGLGHVSGMPDGNFHPDEKITLEQFVAMVIRGKYGVLPGDGGNWASGYMKMAAGKGLLDGADITDDGIITRETAAKVLDIATQSLWGEDSVNDTSAAESYITDFPSCHTCRTHISNVFTRGIMTGKPGGIFDSAGTLTRAEACVAIMRLLDKNLRVPPEL
ncbi:MAG: S-layer homology domain-containing protein [Clostridiales Family XIII bacterium]|jgi:hypothetical protein|nr:S-layer homology domain-containing protein [Clostridiales Family XIII bacterium]